MLDKTKSNIKGLFHFAEKTTHLNLHEPTLKKPAKYKSYAPAFAVKATILAMLFGKFSANGIKKVADQIAEKRSGKSSIARSTIGSLLSEERVGEFLTSHLLYHRAVIKRLRIDKLPGLGGKVLATLDAIDVGELNHGCESCSLCLTRMRDGIPYHFHKLVVLSIATERGPVPIAFRFVLPADISHLDLENLSDEKFKAECELTAAKALLAEVAKKNHGKLPFDLLSADALFANAPFMETIESYGVGGIFAFKQENRKLFRDAQKDFSDGGFGFNLQSDNWSDEDLDRKYVAKSGVYEDHNRKGDDKSVKIFRITRKEGDSENTVFLITSNFDFITAKVVEKARFIRWSNHENRIFNALTNGWKIAKHIPFHISGTMISVAALMLICLGVCNLYINGNLTRGGRSFKESLQEFFSQNLTSFTSYSTKKLLSILYRPPPNNQT